MNDMNDQFFVIDEVGVAPSANGLTGANTF